MEYEQNYSELLREQPIAGVKAILDYALYRQASLTNEDSTEEHDYWYNVEIDCEKELELRIKQIFP